MINAPLDGEGKGNRVVVVPFCVHSHSIASLCSFRSVEYSQYTDDGEKRRYWPFLHACDGSIVHPDVVDFLPPEL